MAHWFSVVVALCALVLTFRASDALLSSKIVRVVASKRIPRTLRSECAFSTAGTRKHGVDMQLSMAKDGLNRVTADKPMWTNMKSIRAKMEPMAKLRFAGKAIVGTITSVYGLGMVRGKIIEIIAFIASVAVGSGVVPALVIGFGTKQPEVDSMRTDEIKSLKRKISVLNDPSNQSYIVVEGDKGLGKSCLIEFALKDTKGVVQVKIPSGTKEENVFEKGTAAIAGASSDFFVGSLASSSRAKWTIYWHRLFFDVAPTLVLSASEVPEGSVNKEPAELTGAVRALIEMGLRVVVDSSPNSLTKGILSTKRARVIHVEDMTSEQIRLLPQLANLFDRLDAHPGLSDAVYDLLGGNPADFESLHRKVSRLSADTDVRTAVEALCVERLGDVRKQHRDLIKNAPKFVEILKLFKTSNAVSDTVLEENSVDLPTPCKILQLKGMPTMVIPKTTMAAFFFKNSCDFTTAKEALHNLIWESPNSVAPHHKCELWYC